MANGEDQKQGGVAGILRKQLAVAVKNIQWSYAIFWSISSKQPGILEWGEGYYNGDIKTRKTVQAPHVEMLMECEDDELGLERSEQLRELFKCLSAAAKKPQAAARRPSTALVPEDLTDLEWYFLVCMTFVFNLGQGLPGRTLTNNKIMWWCNANCSDSITFSRSLLARSASIQTVVCFPHLGGVIELGTTEKVLEDHNIILQIKSSLQEMSYQKLSKFSRNHQDFALTNLDHEIFDSNLDLVTEFEEVIFGSPQNSSNGVEQYNQAEESLVVEGRDFGDSLELRWQFMDDGISNCVNNNPMSSSDSISQNLVMVPVKKASFDFRGEDVHYQGILSTLFKNSSSLILGPQVRNQRNSDSGFVSWPKGGLFDKQKHYCGGPSQVLLKKALFEVAKMHGRCLINSPVDNGRRNSIWRPEADDIEDSNVLAERRRRERMNQGFSILSSLVPSSGKADKVSVLEGTIEYLKQLEKRIGDLKSGMKRGERQRRTRKKRHCAEERTSDDYGDNEIASRKKPLLSKRKACTVSERENETRAISTDDGVSVSITEKNVLIEIQCPWRENLLFEIMDATSTLHLDSYSVQSSNVDGFLSLSIGSKLKNSKEASAGMIMRALERIIEKG